MKEVVLSKEMKKTLKGRYIMDEENGVMIRLGEFVELTSENFRVYFIDDKGIWQELTVEDFNWCKEDGTDKDYVFFKDKKRIKYIMNEYVPKEVQKFLDYNIKKRLLYKSK